MDNAEWERDVEIVGIIESEPQKESFFYHGKLYKIYKPEELKELEYNSIILANVCWEDEENRLGKGDLGTEQC